MADIAALQMKYSTHSFAISSVKSVTLDWALRKVCSLQRIQKVLLMDPSPVPERRWVEQLALISVKNTLPTDKTKMGFEKVRISFKEVVVFEIMSSICPFFHLCPSYPRDKLGQVPGRN